MKYGRSSAFNPTTDGRRGDRDAIEDDSKSQFHINTYDKSTEADKDVKWCMDP